MRRSNRQGNKEIDMIGKIIGAVVGAKMAERERGGLNAPGGALLGIGTAALARRLGPMGMLAALAGGYIFKRYRDGRAERGARPPKVRPSAG
jgi:hypothetical protein